VKGRFMEKKRLSLDISKELHKKIKIRAAIRNISMLRWISRAIMKAIKEEEKYD